MSRRRLPAISALLARPELGGLPHAVAVRAARAAVAAARGRIKDADAQDEVALLSTLAADAALRAARERAPHLRRVINATGIVLHTNLGRAPLAVAAAEALAQIAAGYSNAELDLQTGRRGGRLDGVAPLICALTGAEAALAVNNNAAAVLLALSALASGREVIVSRGELVEIGGSFRVPDVISSGGARLVEVGTTNRTRVADYAAAITPNTAVILRVHPSNFRMTGFVQRPARAALAALAADRGLPLIDDLGSGALPPALPFRDELWQDCDPVDQAIVEGADLVCFSGDKLMGGPQSGLVAGRADLVARLKEHPLYRALRLDKLVLGALEATLKLYHEGRADEVPTRALLGRDQAWCQREADALSAQIPGSRVEADLGYSGGGALPDAGLPTVVVVVPAKDADGLAAALRANDPPIVARVAQGALRLDPRTLLGTDVSDVVAALARITATGQD